MFGHKWSIGVFTNPGIIDWKVSPHFYFWNGDEESGDIDPSFSSPHLNMLDENEAYRAYGRITTLLRMASAVKIIFGGNMVENDGSVLYFTNGHYTRPWIEEDWNILIEEMTDPFDPLMTQKIRSEMSVRIPKLAEFIIDESIDNPTARDILLWITLGEEQLLYFFINAYKIMDSIKTDIKTYQKRNEFKPSESLITASANMQRHSHYMNTMAGSRRLARHGATTQTAPSKSPTIEEIKQDLIDLVLDWFRYRFSIKYIK
ncbi:MULTISPECIES: hypothetical protein [unclassified Sporosarcina]|uniref:hypothetical protein n=1 Tax=unclassified Sporosarcina TaxID=2647733 RepID=UPI00203F68D8|nr:MULTISPECIES: hypothetical protein [unclassified Sporosarcina]GKV65549.1 hypothetical protein NCCP2331_17020 [Sporosarcina sp. NCCP-2331]GLB55674.1 hypothetical protein NCCP2378_14610 [Sporosarcina sp. NCCP-2378]